MKKTAHKSDLMYKRCYLGCWCPLVPFISETVRELGKICLKNTSGKSHKESKEKKKQPNLT